MRVLMVIRADADKVFGGDIVQVTQTKSFLEKRGTQIELCRVDCLPETADFDLVHFFHLPIITPEVIKWAQGQQKPIVLAPVFWATTELWFEAARTSHQKWRLLTSILGRSLAERVYLSWQATKQPSQPMWQIWRDFLIMADALLPNSRMEAQLLQSYFRLENNLQQKSYVIPNGINPHLFEDLSEQADIFVAAYNCRDFVLEVARIELAKNQLGLIEALFDLPVPIVLIGKPSPYEPEYVARCRERARERGNVLFIEHIPYEKLSGAYAAASVHALPSWRETPGLTSLEAAAAGCKVVSTSLGCAQEYFGELAWYCHPAYLSSIRTAVTNALSAPASTTLRQRVLEEFTWQQAANLTYQAYHSVLEGKRANSISL